jgi:hypothetical protein
MGNGMGSRKIESPRNTLSCGEKMKFTFKKFPGSNRRNSSLQLHATLLYEEQS